MSDPNTRKKCTPACDPSKEKREVSVSQHQYESEYTCGVCGSKRIERVHRAGGGRVETNDDIIV